MDQLAQKGESLSVEEQEELKRPTLKKYSEESSAYYSSARLWDDGIIDPADSRRVLALGMSASFNKKWPDKTKGVFRM